MGPRGPTATGDLAWAKEAEPVLDTHLGQGAKLFRWVLVGGSLARG